MHHRLRGEADLHLLPEVRALCGNLPVVVLHLSSADLCGVGEWVLFLRRSRGQWHWGSVHTCERSCQTGEAVSCSRTFRRNDSVFSNQRLYTDGVYASFIAVSRSSSILTDAAFQEIVTLDRKVKELNASMGHEVLTFEGLCARRYKKCIPNKILDIYKYYGNNLETTELTFPFFRFGFSHIFLGYSVGGVNINSSVIKSAKAVRLFYFLKEVNRSTTDLWLNEFLKVFPSNLSLNFIKVGYILFMYCLSSLMAIGASCHKSCMSTVSVTFWVKRYRNACFWFQCSYVVFKYLVLIGLKLWSHAIYHILQ